ncbi:hypothetical protein SLE2022_328570 [Rubroshorea leprosula]
MMKVRRSKKQIRELESLDGKRFVSQEEKVAEAVSFFQLLLGIEDPNCGRNSEEWLKELFDYQLPDEMKQRLVQPVAPNEINGVIFSSPPNKSPSPNGFTAKFYKSA